MPAHRTVTRRAARGAEVGGCFLCRLGHCLRPRVSVVAVAIVARAVGVTWARRDLALGRGRLRGRRGGELERDLESHCRSGVAGETGDLEDDRCTVLGGFGEADMQVQGRGYLTGGGRLGMEWPREPGPSRSVGVIKSGTSSEPRGVRRFSGTV